MRKTKEAEQAAVAAAKSTPEGIELLRQTAHDALSELRESAEEAAGDDEEALQEITDVIDAAITAITTLTGEEELEDKVQTVKEEVQPKIAALSSANTNAVPDAITAAKKEITDHTNGLSNHANKYVADTLKR